MSSMLWMRARWLPSTSTFTVPSGSFSICRMLEMQPILYRSSAVGSSLAADFCATRRMLLPASIAISIALIDFGRPTKRGMTMWGNTTTSRSGSSGYWLGAVDTISSAMAFPGEGSKTALLGRNAPLQAGPRSRTARRSSGTRHLRRLGVDEKGLAFAHDGIFVHHDLAHVLHRRKIEHDVEQHLLEYGAQAARPGLPRQGLLRDRLQRLRPHFQIDRFHAEEFLVLLDERVLRLRQDLDQSLLVEFLEGRHHRQPADELRNKPILDVVFRLDGLEDLADVLRALQAPHVGREADSALLGTAADDLFQAVERPAADEQDVGGVHLHEVLVGMLAPALRRHRGDGPFDQLQQRLLHAFARHVPRDRGVVGLAGNLVDLVDVDDAALGLVDVVVAVLQQLLDDVLDVLADVARLGEGGRIRDHERNVQQPRHGLGEQRLSGPGRTDQEDVRFGELDLVVLREVLEPLVVVVHRHRQDLLRDLLADDVLVEDAADLARRRQVGLGGLAAFVGRALLADDVVAQLDALVADEHRGAGDELPHLVLALAAEGAVEELLAAGLLAHRVFSASGRRGRRLGPRGEHLVDQTVLYRVVRRQEIVTIRVPGDALDALAGVQGHDLVQALPEVEDLLG